MFTERFDEVKPREHNLLAVPIERTVPERARVALEHRYLDRHGAGWESFTSLGEGSGWPLYLDRFRDATQRDAARA
ncbi:hypothetical protein AMES_5615 [Amycolatopsis mediterranei S699]|uniref:Uncharacterized protein n=3 Tax=Amycolatopsis mediterranei TaxID=33910 RepID=A0A0H3D8W8_AMYMU|nr:conserved hypothetical protein [Amycolatopsis mediterranei U32]AEK44287.1 hypothetical protein RAM_29050 [Amycolatopsis mediterranei S699]AGT86279.1 hypothetical protein B737_5615 [Amycolatopsis mediterranei RB]KDO12636.1 hypothetical protein DV26_01575 [Amycolatopsis mediterranei]AFO79151.1 hypothetical protein AMES_5615 [Amycolatopsis mediterranei S699]